MEDDDIKREKKLWLAFSYSGINSGQAKAFKYFLLCFLPILPISIWFDAG
jgi:hypothetical protein